MWNWSKTWLISASRAYKAVHATIEVYTGLDSWQLQVANLLSHWTGLTAVPCEAFINSCPFQRRSVRQRAEAFPRKSKPNDKLIMLFPLIHQPFATDDFPTLFLLARLRMPSSFLKVNLSMREFRSLKRRLSDADSCIICDDLRGF